MNLKQTFMIDEIREYFTIIKEHKRRCKFEHYHC